jgi:hypothetical protein
LRQSFGEDDRLIMPGRVREADDAHLAAGAGASFVRATTVPATRPTFAPVRTARANSAHDCTRMRLSVAA